jgi:hypothetical protein
MINAYGDILMATSTAPQQTLPGPSALPLLGSEANMLKLFRDPCTYSRWLHDTYGDVVAMAQGDPAYVFALIPVRNQMEQKHGAGTR